jgi:hypothetical protein
MDRTYPWSVIPVFMVALAFASCSENSGSQPDAQSDEPTAWVSVTLLDLLLSEGLDVAGTCAPGKYVLGRLGIQNDTGAEIELCELTVQLFQTPEDTRMVCLVDESSIPDGAAPAGQSDRPVLVDVSDNETFECAIPFSFTPVPQCGEALVEVSWVKFPQTCDTGVKQSSTTLGTFSCLTVEICV